MGLLDKFANFVEGIPLVGDVADSAANFVGSVPIIGPMLADSPEDKANKALQAGIGQAGGDLRGGFGQAQQMYNPYAGLAQSLPGLQQRVSQGLYNVDSPGFEQFDFQFSQDPGQQFAQQQGTEAVQAMLNARGMGDSGREMKEVAKFTTGLAGQQYGANRERAFREFTGRQGRRMGLAQFGQNQLQNQLMQELGLGQTGLNVVGQQANLHTGLAQGLADLSLGRGQANASEHMATGAQNRSLLDQAFKLLPNIMGQGDGGGGGSELYAGDPYQSTGGVYNA